MKCKICGNASVVFEQGLVLHKHIVEYFVCTHCGFVFTETPHWLDEAYSSVINRYDIGLINRNQRMAYHTKSLINGVLNGNGQFLDYGGGYGVFVRMMRDEGFNFYRDDPMCKNLFANGFDVEDAPRKQFEAVTAFEVFEHLVDPLADIQKMLTYADTIIFSTLMVLTPPPPLDTWWYYGLEHGQHVAFYTPATFAHIANTFSLNFYTNYSNLHILTRRTLPVWYMKGLFHSNNLLRWWVNQSHPRRSLLESDSAKLRE